MIEVAVNYFTVKYELYVLNIFLNIKLYYNMNNKQDIFEKTLSVMKEVEKYNDKNGIDKKIL